MVGSTELTTAAPVTSGGVGVYSVSVAVPIFACFGGSRRPRTLATVLSVIVCLEFKRSGRVTGSSDGHSGILRLCFESAIAARNWRLVDRRFW